MNNCTISGAGVINGGEYGDVRCSGAVKLTESVRCESFSGSGSVSGQGDIECTGTFKASGSLSCKGTIKALELRSSGSVKAASIHAETLQCSGAVHIEEGMQCGKIRCAGGVRCGGSVQADEISFSGGLRVKGEVNGDRIEMRLQANSGEVGSIAGGQIKILQENGGFSLLCWLKGKDICLRTESIEGDELDLSNVQACRVTGQNVIIGPCCRIERVEYSGSLTVDPAAEVKEQVKLS